MSYYDLSDRFKYLAIRYVIVLLSKSNKHFLFLSFCRLPLTVFMALITGSVEVVSKLDSDFPKGVLGISPKV